MKKKINSSTKIWISDFIEKDIHTNEEMKKWNELVKDKDIEIISHKTNIMGNYLSIIILYKELKE